MYWLYFRGVINTQGKWRIVTMDGMLENVEGLVRNERDKLREAKVKFTSKMS